MRLLFFRLMTFAGLALIFPAAIVNAQIAADGSYQPFAPADLQSLAAPVALYPDAMLAQILVASTYPDDVVAAAQFLDGGGDPNAVDVQGWDVSVAGVARYPDLLSLHGQQRRLDE